MAVRWLLSCLCLLALAAPKAHTEQFRGVSSFAAMHPAFPCDRWLSIYDEAVRRKPDFLPAMAILWGDFGDDESCVKKFTERFADRPHVVEVHVMNGPGRRNKQLAEGSFFPEWSVGELNVRLQTGDYIALGGVHWVLARIDEFTRRVGNANTRWLLSWELEANLSVPAAQMWEAHYRTLVFLGLLQPFALVANPHSPRHFGGAEFREFHSPHGTPSGVPNCVANEDGKYGQSPSESKAFLKRYRKCAVAFLWRGDHQGRSEGSRFLPPKNRNFVISDRDIRDLPKVLTE